jgi:hypothetical protein
VQYPTWLAAYDAWMGQFLRLKELKMRSWVQRAVVSVQAKILLDASLDAQTQTTLLTFVTAQSLTFPSAGWMSEGAMQFGPKYAQMMSIF